MSWEIYDELLSAIPNDITIEDVYQQKWWLIKTKETLGMAMHFEQGEAVRTLPKQLKGVRLKVLASYIKSWNFHEASAGVAAINSYFNQQEKVMLFAPKLTQSVFKEYEQEITGKRVAVIGHFPGIEKLATTCDLSILEKKPSLGDYPDSACEYILPEQDYVFITGTALANKTLPRLLALSKNSKIIMTGPSVPLTPIFFNYGVDVLAGSVVSDHQGLWGRVKKEGCEDIFQEGVQMLQINKK